MQPPTENDPSIPSSWAELQQFIFPKNPRITSQQPFSTCTAPYQGLDEARHDIAFSLRDNTLIDRLRNFLPAFFGQAGDGTPAPFPARLQSVFSHELFTFQRTSCNSEVGAVILFSTICSILLRVVPAALQLRGVQSASFERGEPSLYSRQRGDSHVSVEIDNTTRKRVALEFKNPAVLISKRFGLESNELLTSTTRNEDARAMKVRLGLQMELAPNPEDPAEALPARFGFFFTGFTAVVVEKVVSVDGKHGLLVSPQFRVCKENLPLFNTTTDITPNYNDSNPILPAPFLALILSAVLDDLIPGETVAQAPKPNLAPLPPLQERENDEGDNDDEDEGEDGDDYKADPDWTVTNARQGRRGGGKSRGRGGQKGRGKYRGGNQRPAMFTMEIVGPVPRRFSVSAIPIQFPSPTLSSSSTFASPPPSPMFSLPMYQRSPSTSSSILSRSPEDAEESKVVTCEPDLSTPRPLSFYLFPIRLSTLIHGNERGRTWRGTWDALPKEDRQIVIKFCFERSYFERELAVYRALTQASQQEQLDEKEMVEFEVRSKPPIAPTLHAAFENEERTWTALVLEDIGESLHDEYMSWGDLYEDDPGFFAHIRRNLHRLHKLGFYHNDFEPRNVSQDGRLFDFGHSTPHDDGVCKLNKCQELTDLKKSGMTGRC